MPSTWSPRLVTMTWKMVSKETLVSNMLTLEQMMKSCSVKWEGLPGWQTKFEIAAHFRRLELCLLLWPEPTPD